MLVVTRKTWIEILEPHELLATARTQSHRTLAQTIHQVYVADFKQTERAGVSRIAAAVVHHVRLFLFDIDDHVALAVPVSGLTRRLGPDDDLPVSVREIQLTLCV